MIAWFARHPTAANLLMLLIMGLGLKSLPDFVRTTFPDTRLGEVEVRVLYPGATPLDVEYAVCRKLEDSVEGIPGIDEVRCTAELNQAVMKIPSLEGSDFQRLIQDVKTAVDSIKDLPALSERAVVTHSNRMDVVMSLLVGAPMSKSDLKAYAENLRSMLKARLPKSSLEIQGFSDHQLLVELNTVRMQELMIGAEVVRQALEREGIRLPLGTIQTRPEEFTLRIQNEPKNIKELSEIVILARDGLEVRLEDIATIRDHFEEMPGEIIVYDEHKNQLPGFLLDLKILPTEDALNLSFEIEEFLKTLILPQGAVLKVTQDSTSMVKDRLQMIVDNGFVGAFLVICVLVLFFGFRFAVWVVLGLPVSFLGALWLMPYFDQSINMMTMVGLLLGIGILMDDSTVISENIASRMAKGDGPVEAAIRGTHEVFASVLSSYLTTASMFGGLVFIGGDIGRVLKVMPLVLLMVITVSLIEAFLILPHHVKESFSQNRVRGRFRLAFDTWFEQFRDVRVRGWIEFSVRHRHLTLSVSILFFFSSIALMQGGFVRGSVFPKLEGNAVVARVLLPAGSDREETVKVLGHVEQAFRSTVAQYESNQNQKLVESLYYRVGSHPDSGETGFHAASLMAEILSSENRWFVLDDFLRDWRRAIGDVPGVLSITTKEPVWGPGGRPFELRLSHPNSDVLLEASQRLKLWLTQFDGVSGITDDMKSGAFEIVLGLKPGAWNYGINSAYLASEIRSRLQGGLAKRVQYGSEDLELTIQLPKTIRQGSEFLDEMMVSIPAYGSVPLSEIATWSFTRGLSRIPRVNSQRVIHVSCEIDSRRTNTPTLVSRFFSEEYPGFLKQWPDLKITVEGQLKAGKESQESMISAMLMGIFGIFLILSFQFGSFREPLLVMSVIPFALSGVIYGHFIMGHDLSLPSVIGFVSLIGVVVNNSILLVHFMHEHMQESGTLAEAALQSCIQRFRPIVITTSTTVAGMLPMLFEKSLQAQILIPLAISLVFGLVAGTVLVLVVLPSLYCTLQDLGIKFRRES
ncbi:MAG: efflux RND transporter permease subunit [Candidatus Cloacimonetes bacterium]|nr:efflux RND transporter permease subunit [Candidatus Cloacimonadota bacterium]